jgi:hypothetical protein
MTARTPLPSDALPADPPTDRGAWARGVVERHVAVEQQLAEAGLRLALAIEQAATQAVAEGRAPDKDAAMAFSRVARAVRMSGLLQAKLIREEEEARRRAEAEQLRAAKQAIAAFHGEADEDEDPALLPPDERHKYRVTRIVARIAEAEHRDDEEECERLVMEAAERLDDEDIYDDVLSRPLGELVSRLCRDLDLEPDWKRLSEEAWAREEIESGVPSSPFTILSAARAPPFSAENGGEDPRADPGAKPGEERVGVGEGNIHPPFDRPSERPPIAWSG